MVRTINFYKKDKARNEIFGSIVWSSIAYCINQHNIILK